MNRIYVHFHQDIEMYVLSAHRIFTIFICMFSIRLICQSVECSVSNVLHFVTRIFLFSSSTRSFKQMSLSDVWKQSYCYIHSPLTASLCVCSRLSNHQFPGKNMEYTQLDAVYHAFDFSLYSSLSVVMLLLCCCCKCECFNSFRFATHCLHARMRRKFIVCTKKTIIIFVFKTFENIRRVLSPFCSYFLSIACFKHSNTSKLMFLVSMFRKNGILWIATKNRHLNIYVESFLFRKYISYGCLRCNWKSLTFIFI